MVSLSIPQVPVSLAAIAAVVVVALAGCLDPGDVAGDVTLPFDREALRLHTTQFFADAWALSEAEPLGDTKRAPLGDFYTRWAVGEGFPEWVSKPFDEPVLITGEVRLEFWVTTETIVTSTPGIFPDFVVYFGTSESVLAVESPTRIDPVAHDLSVIQSGEAVPVRATFALPPGGITVPSGAGVRVITAPVMMESDAADLEVLYGSQEFPSQVRYNTTYLNEEPWAGLDSETDKTSHQLVAGSFLHGTEEEGVTVKTLPVAIENPTKALLVDLVYTGSTPFPDMDLYVYAPNGTQMALSVTPGSDEAVHLYARNLEAGGPGTWTIKVVNYVTPGATFDVAITRYG